MNNEPIFITGIQRSGATLIAKILTIAGANPGKVNKMMENVYFNGLLYAYYSKLKVDLHGQYPLPDCKDLVSIEKGKVDELLNNKYPVEFVKSSKLGQTWPMWHRNYPNARWIIVRRRTGDIIYSCLHTAFMTAFKKPEVRQMIGVEDERAGWLWWVHEHESRFVEMIEAGLNCMVVWPDRMVNGDYTQIEQMLNWLNLPYDENRIKEIVEPLIWKSKINKSKMK